VFQVAGQVLFELLAGLGWESLGQGLRRERRANPALAAIGHFLMGSLAGVLSLLIFEGRFFARPAIPGLSLVLSPIATGIAMHWLGELWRSRGRDVPALFSFRAGAIFAFGMALVRFVYLELGWSPF
jgi:hypothetical protein